MKAMDFLKIQKKKVKGKMGKTSTEEGVNLKKRG